ncbi:WAT1-related protein At1g25270-like [Rosa rugosa]|uniref:WAT1-related protein At1g25270-like n=1 Tax=Rosa rugosa TaxID=74645 RepID=UPI002B415A15|nr:WAT1-related protein At1g25270-like [Rosa rugosa]
MMMMGGTWIELCNALHGLKLVLLMVAVQVTFAGVNVLYKLAANDGMNTNLVIAYRFLFATAFLTPFALYFERKSRPKLTWMVVLQAFLCGLFGGAMSQNMYIASIALTSATFTCAITQLIPAITFVLAVIFRLERLNLRSMGGKAKVLGTLMGIGGAMLLTFYKGVEINIWSTHVDLLHTSHQPSRHVAAHNSRTDFTDRILSCLLALGSSLGYALWLIIQAKMGERYPCYYSSTALMSLMGSIQSVGFALCMERDWNQWKLGWNIRLLAVAYTGIVATGISVTIIALCVRMKGPLFVSVFNPLVLVLVAFVGSLLLDEKLHLGSVLGSILIVGGLYTVLWGKSKDIKMKSVPRSFEEEFAESLEIVTRSPDDKANNNKNESETKNNAPNTLPT